MEGEQDSLSLGPGCVQSLDLSIGATSFSDSSGDIPTTQSVEILALLDDAFDLATILAGNDLDPLNDVVPRKQVLYRCKTKPRSDASGRKLVKFAFVSEIDSYEYESAKPGRGGSLSSKRLMKYQRRNSKTSAMMLLAMGNKQSR